MTLWAVERLALGTVQFGLGYGLAAGQKQVPRTSVQNILDTARHAGLRVLDTAAAYGESEAVLGQSSGLEAFDLISKTMPVRKNPISKEHLGLVQGAFDQTLLSLQCARLDTLLVHDAHDLLADGGDRLWHWMESLKSAGSVRRIGVSVYDSETARRVVQRYPVEIIQIPFNVFDQRIARDGFLEFCSDRSISIHARSVFLQGVILMNSNALPPALKGLRPFLDRFHALSKSVNLTPQSLALAYVGQRPEIENLVVGIHDPFQLDLLLEAWQSLGSTNVEQLDWADLFCNDQNLIDPRFWP